MACDIRGIINDFLAIRSAITDKDIKVGLRSGIDLQDKAWHCAYGDGGIGTLSVSEAERTELKAVIASVQETAATAQAEVGAQAWGDGKFLEFILKWLIPLIIGFLGEEGGA